MCLLNLVCNETDAGMLGIGSGQLQSKRAQNLKQAALLAIVVVSEKEPAIHDQSQSIKDKSCGKPLARPRTNR